MSPVPQQTSSARWPGRTAASSTTRRFQLPVKAKALQVVEQIITPGNGGEKVVDLRGALFARGVEDVAHGHSLAEEPVAKSKCINCALPLCPFLVQTLLATRV